MPDNICRNQVNGLTTLISEIEPGIGETITLVSKFQKSELVLECTSCSSRISAVAISFGWGAGPVCGSVRGGMM